MDSNFVRTCHAPVIMAKQEKDGPDKCFCATAKWQKNRSYLVYAKSGVGKAINSISNPAFCMTCRRLMNWNGKGQGHHRPGPSCLWELPGIQTGPRPYQTSSASCMISLFEYARLMRSPFQYRCNPFVTGCSFYRARIRHGPGHPCFLYNKPYSCPTSC